MPASELRSVMPSAVMPRSFACSNSSCGLEAPRRNEKWVVTWSSAYMRGVVVHHEKKPCIHQRPPSAVGASRKIQ
jgi:hypothetical protein